MNGITPTDLMTAITVLLAVLAAIITIDKAIDIFKKWRTPATDIAKMLANDKRRLDEHEEAVKDLQACNRVICNGVLALLDHELHNGNSDQMERARNDLMVYLQGLLVK